MMSIAAVKFGGQIRLIAGENSRLMLWGLSMVWLWLLAWGQPVRLLGWLNRCGPINSAMTIWL